MYENVAQKHSLSCNLNIIIRGIDIEISRIVKRDFIYDALAVVIYCFSASERYTSSIEIPCRLA